MIACMTRERYNTVPQATQMRLRLQASSECT